MAEIVAMHLHRLGAARAKSISFVSACAVWIWDSIDAIVQQAGIPLGSGAIESSIRRVINSRLKGNGLFWREENAESMLHLRALVISDRWDEQMQSMRQYRKTSHLPDWKWTPLPMTNKSEPKLKSTQNTA